MSVVWVHGPRVLALSSRGELHLDRRELAFRQVVVRSQRDPLVFAVPVQRDPVGLAVTALGQLGAQHVERLEPGTVGVGLGQLRLVDDADVVDLQVPARESHAPPGHCVRSRPTAKRERDGAVRETCPVLPSKEQRAEEVRPR